MNIAVYIEGKAVSSQQIERWERKRMAVVTRLLRAKLDQSALSPLANSRDGGQQPNPASIRVAIAQAKTGVSPHQIRSMLKNRMALSAALAKLFNFVSWGKRKPCVIEMWVEGCSAEQIVERLDGLFLTSSPQNRELCLAACPDHYLLEPYGENRQEVIETTGGSPLPLQFFITYGEEKNLSIPRDPAYALQAAGVARLKDGTVIGGVRHQFRNEGAGFRARLAVEFPWVTPRYFIREHQMHLACEFSNWVSGLIK